MAVGATGSGKSTLVNSLIQGVGQMGSDDDGNIRANQNLVYNGKEQFVIGDGVESCTRNPGFFKYNNLYIVDCPGLNDNDRFLEYPNQTCIHNIQKSA